MIVDAEDFVPGKEPGVAPAPLAFVLPDGANLFARRALRLRTLADGHPMGDFLSFVADLSLAQHGLVDQGGSWQDLLPSLLRAVLDRPSTEAVAEAVALLQGESSASIAGRAERWLAGTPDTADLTGAPFIAAALQIERVRMAATAEAAFDHAGRCPLCGGAPVAATLGTKGDIVGLRYLHCGLCATAWHLERLACPGCGSEGKLVYHHLDGYEPKVKAETCGECGTYVKLFDTDTCSGIEPLADDLASLALDFLLAEEGWRRLWPNPFLHGA